MRLGTWWLVSIPFALIACGDDESAAGTGGGTSSVSVSVSVSTADAASSTTGTAAVTTSGAGGDSSTGGGGDGSGAAGGGTGTSGQGGDGGAGTGGSGTTGQGGSTSSGDPIDCAVCVATECPQLAECIGDPACAEGLACTLTGCIVDGQPDLLCIADCFGGDFNAALDAIEALSCIVTTCGDGCGGLIPAG